MKVAKKKPAKKTAPTKPAGEPVSGLTVGKTTGLGVAAFWSKLLADNGKRKLTDERLTKAFRKEFPDREIAQPVGRVRSMYNRGILGYGNPPGKVVKGTPKQSYAYDAEGEVTTSSAWDTGRKPNPACVAAGAERAAKRWGKKAKPKGKGGKIKVKRAKPKTAPAPSSKSAGKSAKSGKSAKPGKAKIGKGKPAKSGGKPSRKPASGPPAPVSAETTPAAAV